MKILSALEGVAWPAVPSPRGAALLSLLYQFDQSQWWSGSELADRQFEQLGELLQHARETVPYYQSRPEYQLAERKARAGPELLDGLPLLTRRDIQAHGESLVSTRVPAGHGERVERRSGGSTGEPVRVVATELDALFWQALTVRDHLWHRRDFAGKLCIIRSRVENGEAPGWGPATDALTQTGPSAVLNIRTDPERQLEWLRKHDPDYLLSHPTNLRELALRSRTQGIRLGRLKGLRTFGEMLPEGLRELCRDTWNVGITDTYSAEEVGYIALQCPGHEHYHVQSENLLVEVLDAAGRQCRAGEVGRVVVTPLHNFAMPLVRYAIGDYAEVGAPCACKRGLPVLRRILGRSRNMLTLPDGTRYWPSTPVIRYSGIAPIQQLQMIQRTRRGVEARFVAERPLHAAEESAMVAAIHDALGFPFEVTLRQVDAIERSPSMKFEDFLSLVAADE